jgi:hypothetical protein
MERNRDLINACHAKDRTAISSLIQAISKDRWEVVPGLATAQLESITFQVWHTSGGSGIISRTLIDLRIVRT